MTTALTLPQAAGLAFDNLQVKWLIGGSLLKNRINQFWGFSKSLFPDQAASGRPVANWLTLIAGLESVMPSSQAPIGQLTTAAEYVYRTCWMAEALRVQSLITSAQATALLANYNGAFA